MGIINEDVTSPPPYFCTVLSEKHPTGVISFYNSGSSTNNQTRRGNGNG